jgi:uncharacterized protein YraI
LNYLAFFATSRLCLSSQVIYLHAGGVAMRWPVVAVICTVCTTAAAAEQTFPYKAYVTTDGVDVRSGPGENYYATDKLRAGQEVEVYRHDPSGWYAIRPPVGSFSWVSARQLQLRAGGLAIVSEPQTASCVGSRLSAARDVIQVRLDRGETVAVLEAGQVAEKGTGPICAQHPSDRSGKLDLSPVPAWHKISPPSGEFRWVSGRFVDPNYYRGGPRTTEVAGRPAAGPTATSPSNSSKNAEQLHEELNDLDLELSTIVVEEPALWQLGDLRQRAQRLVEQAETGVDRGRARLLLGRIERFEEIRQRFNKQDAAGEQLARTNREEKGTVPICAQHPPGRSGKWGLSPVPPDADSRFDAAGRLARIRASKPGAPQYAVVDDGGHIRCYVSPAPGINLRYYVGQQVGINGTRGYMPEQQADHVMARHVSVLDSPLLR